VRLVGFESGPAASTQKRAFRTRKADPKSCPSAFAPGTVIHPTPHLARLQTSKPSATVVPMKRFLILAAALSMAACSSPEARRQADLMNKIEKEVRLPPGAEAIDSFARAYKFESPDRVVAFYFFPVDQPDQWFCDGAKKGGRTNGQIALACPPPDGMKAGERRWFGDDVSLPDRSDGGCDIEYDVGSNTITFATCDYLRPWSPSLGRMMPSRFPPIGRLREANPTPQSDRPETPQRQIP